MSKFSEKKFWRKLFVEAKSELAQNEGVLQERHESWKKLYDEQELKINALEINNATLRDECARLRDTEKVASEEVLKKELYQLQKIAHRFRVQLIEANLIPSDVDYNCSGCGRLVKHAEPYTVWVIYQGDGKYPLRRALHLDCKPPRQEPLHDLA